MSAERSRPTGIVIFDLDGTLIDDMREIAATAARVISEAFGTPLPEAEMQYFSTTGKPFEMQLLELYPGKSPKLLRSVANHFHDIKIMEAYSKVRVFPEIPQVLKALSRAGWVLVVATGAEKEMAELLLEREGIAFLVDEVMGAGQGTKDMHVREYLRRWPGTPHILVGDSPYDMEVARGFPELFVVGRACNFPGWVLTPSDLKSLGASWADYSLEKLPEALERLASGRR